MVDEMVGIFAALGSVLFFGSYAVPIRLPHVMAAQVDPMIFQFYKSFACFSSAWLLLLFVPLRFTWWGVAGGGLWVMTGVGAIAAVQLAGIGTAQALWSGLSIFVSYIWGAYYFKEPIHNHALALLALVIMTVGMIGVGSAASVNRLLSHPGKFQKSPPQSPQLKKGESIMMMMASWSLQVDFHVVWQEEPVNDESLIKSLVSDEEQANGSSIDCGKKETEYRFIQGVLCAVFVGLLNGSFMLPLKFANTDVIGAEYVFSFGVGAMVIMSLLLPLYCLVQVCRNRPCPSFQFRVAALPALSTGYLWSMGNLCSVYATLYLGMSLGWPMVQCQILVSSLWAVFYYEEVTGRYDKSLLIGSSALVVSGVVMLSRFGTTN